MRFRRGHWATMRFPWSAPPAPPPLPPPLTIAGKVLSFTAPSVTDSTFPAIATAIICIVLTIVAILIAKKRTKLALLPEHLRLGVTLAVRTHKSGAKFDVAMSSAQKAAFETALVEDFDSIETSLSKVDVSKATCRNPADTRAILDELEKHVGFAACNTQIVGVLREALVARGRAALARLPEGERGTSVLLSNLGVLLRDMGKLEEARPLYEEYMQGCKETLGDRHPHTLVSINGMGALLQDLGKLEEARPLLEEGLQARRETLGDRHPHTLISISNMGQLLQAMGKLDEARPLLEEALQASRETLGDRHASTLVSINSMGGLLMAMGKLEEARPLYEEALQASKETRGDRHPHTLAYQRNLSRLM